MANPLTTKDSQGRRVVLHVHPLRGAILSLIRHNRTGEGTTHIGLALTAAECRELAALFAEAGQDR